MGLEAECALRQGRKVLPGRALLESTEIIFRGDVRLKILLNEVTAVEVKGDDLRIVWPDGVAVLTLGAAAEKWARKIRTPRGLMDKLGVKPDSWVSVIGVADGAILKDIRGRTFNVTEGKAAKGSELVLVSMKTRKDLAQLARLREAIRENGAIWVFWPKGRKELREDDVRAAALCVGLVDIKVASVSETLSGLKLVIPVAQRSGKT